MIEQVSAKTVARKLLPEVVRVFIIAQHAGKVSRHSLPMVLRDTLGVHQPVRMAGQTSANVLQDAHQ